MIPVDSLSNAATTDEAFVIINVKLPHLSGSPADLKAKIDSGAQARTFKYALTETKTRYTNIERELPAVMYGCERFHTYLFGHPSVVESDHKPLESIHLKHLTSSDISSIHPKHHPKVTRFFDVYVERV